MQNCNTFLCVNLLILGKKWNIIRATNKQISPEEATFVDEELLRQRIAACGLTVCSFAYQIGVNRCTSSRWIDRPESLPLGMLRAIRDTLGLSDEDVIRIFLPCEHNQNANRI